MGKLEEWREQWNNGDIKFVPDLFALAEAQEKEIENLRQYYNLWLECQRYLQENKIIIENKQKHDAADLMEMKSEGLLTEDEYWSRFKEDEAFSAFMKKMENRNL